MTGINAETGYVTFTCKRTGYNDIIKTFNLIKIKTGADGKTPTVYFLEPSVLAINKSENGTFNPTSITFKAYSQTGDAARQEYAGRFKYYENGTTTATSANATDSSSFTYTPIANLSILKVELYVAGGGGNPVDTQSVIVTSDGKTGEDGSK